MCDDDDDESCQLGEDSVGSLKTLVENLETAFKKINKPSKRAQAPFTTPWCRQKNYRCSVAYDAKCMRVLLFVFDQVIWLPMNDPEDEASVEKVKQTLPKEWIKVYRGIPNMLPNIPESSLDVTGTM